MAEKLLNSFANFTVLVIGDVMIDAYLKGEVGRISPEAPVPIVDIRERYYRLGGAANVALNLQSLGAKAIICSVVGKDEKDGLFERLMHEKELPTSGLVHSSSRKTTIKYRVIGNGRQMLRIDEEDLHPLNETEFAQVKETVASILEQEHVDAIVFEDYDKGVLSPELIREIVAMSQQRGIITTVDPKKRNFAYYQGVTLFKPNLKELREGVGGTSGTPSLEEVEHVMREFARANDIEYLFTTMSERGVAMYHLPEDRFFTQPAYLRKISDVSGAGDTVIAVATLCLLSRLTPQQTAQISNLAGGIVCEYAGVTPIPMQQLLDEIKRNSII